MSTFYENPTADAICRDIGWPPDARHRDEAVNGVKYKPLVAESIIHDGRDFRATQVTRRSSQSQRLRAREVALLARQDLPYDGWSYDPFHRERDVSVFLGHVFDRIIGLLVLEKKSRFWYGSWEDLPAFRQGDYFFRGKERWVLEGIWIQPTYRRQKYATRLLHVVAEYLDVPVSKLAWEAHIALSEVAMGFLRHHSTGRLILAAPTIP